MFCRAHIDCCRRKEHRLWHETFSLWKQNSQLQQSYNFLNFNDHYDLFWLEGRGLALGVWPSCCSVPHTHGITWGWIQQEKPGALTGSWPLLPLLLQQQDDSKGPADSLLGYFCGTRCRGEAVARLPRVALQGQWSGGSMKPASQWDLAPLPGSKGTCTELSKTPTQMSQLPGGLSSTLTCYFGLGSVKHGTSPTILPLFPDYHVGSVREWSSCYLCLGKPHGHNPRGVHATFGLVPGGEYLSVGKTPSPFVLYCACLIPSFRVFSKLFSLPIVSPFCLSFTGRGRGVACLDFSFHAGVKTSTCCNSTVRYQHITASVNPKQSLDFYSK